MSVILKYIKYMMHHSIAIYEGYMTGLSLPTPGRLCEALRKAVLTMAGYTSYWVWKIITP